MLTIEIYECQEKSMLYGWIKHHKLPFTLRLSSSSNNPCKPYEDYELPGDYVWINNWKVIKSNDQRTDNEGWQYASRLCRFENKDRLLKIGKSFHDKARRRLWSRDMKYDPSAANYNRHQQQQQSTGRSTRAMSEVTDVSKAMPKIQQGLKFIQAARKRVEEISHQKLESSQLEKMKDLVDTVKSNICDVEMALDQIESKNGSPANLLVTKKLRHDLSKEKIAMDNAVSNVNNYNSDSNNSNIMRASIVPSVGAKTTTLRRQSTTTLKNNPVYSSSLNNVASRENLVFSSSSNGFGNMNFDDLAGVSTGPVKGGNAGAFDPSLLVVPNSSGNGKTRGSKLGIAGMEEEPQDGTFIDRNQHERNVQMMIEERLKPVDEATIMQGIINERSEEIDKVAKGLLQVNEMFADLSKIVQKQQVEIEQIFQNAEKSHAKVEDAYEDIVQANEYQKQSQCVIS